jgi:MoaA/NifB/PqqE/SkfB family radical SAM enzyme
MNLSINPSYFCNFSCEFCYLTPKQLKDQTKINIDQLDKLLSEVPYIEYVDLYGGEIGALNKEYFKQVKSTIRKYYSGEINIITNFSMLNDEFFKDDISLTVSYDFEGREKHEQVFQNMLMSPKEYSILILATKDVIAMNVDEMIMQLNILQNLVSVEIKPYSINQANAHDVTHKEYEEFVIKWMESPIEMNYRFGNEEYIDRSLSGDYNAFSDDHVYITPNGKFGVLEFDEEDKEYFLELDSFEDYKQWTLKEKVSLSEICNNCEYLGSCLTEHYRYVKDLDNGCSGYKGLLDRYNNK